MPGPRLAGQFVLCALLTIAARADEPKPEFDPAHAEKMKEGLELFKAEVKPVFVKHCVACHGGEEVQSQLDLATRKGLLRGGAHGAAIKSGKASESRLVALISHNEKPFMPEGEDKLPQPAIDAISRWIDLGAPYDQPLVENPRDPDAWVERKISADDRKHWAFQPLRSPPTPAVKNEAWAKSAIDRFVLAKLEEKGLTPNGPADKRKLIRRAYFDLIGLPPPAAAVEKFVKDPSPTAYEALIDELLQSPHYGERWGRHWLDAARFAESHGFEQDYDRPHAYHYRDFVIEALNRDLPYDQFVRWQLAGDEFAPDDPLAWKATGFLGAGVFPTQITANEVERTRYDALDDMTATTGAALLGLSIGCARCHDHKFDPIPAADYYRMIATFTTTVRGNMEFEVDKEAFKADKEKFDREHLPFAEAVKKFEAEQLPGRFAAWETTAPAANAKQGKWTVAKILDAKSKGGATLTPQDDGSLLASGKSPDHEQFTFVIEAPAGTHTGVRLEALAHSSFVKGGPGRAGNGNFALSDFRATVRRGEADEPLKLQNAQATFEQTPQNLYVKFAIDEDKQTAWAVDPQFGKDHAATFEFTEPLKLDAAARLTFTLEFNNNTKHSIGRPRLSLTSAPTPLPVEVGGLSADVAAALAAPAEKRTAAQTKTALAWYAPQDEEWKKLKQTEQEHLKSQPQPKKVTMMVCSEGITPIRHHTQGGDFLKETHFLKRGDSDQKQGTATAGFLQVLSSADESRWKESPPTGSKTSYRRRALANWITDTEHGAGALLARVIVNRLWHLHFGRGIVSTPSDFGKQGTPPTNPELLDRLASDFIASGWRLKALHKQLMTSAAYTQSAEFDAADAKADPQNDYLWRFSPRRLEAEIIRDSILAVSGRLDRTHFGAGTLDENHRRRSIYFMVKRSKLITMMQIFDQPEPLVSVGSRPTTTVAPQALHFMNNPQVRESTLSFAKSLEDKTPADATRQGYLSAVGREPDAEETSAATAFLAAQEKSYAAAGRANAKQLALADFCQVLFELNEFVYVE